MSFLLLAPCSSTRKKASLLLKSCSTLFLRKGSFIFLIHFSTHICLAGSQFELVTFWHSATNFMLSPPAVAKARVTKWALQKSLQFLYSSFIEYCYTWCIFIFTFRMKVKKYEIFWIFSWIVWKFLIKFAFRVLHVEFQWNSVFWSCWWNTLGNESVPRYYNHATRSGTIQSPLQHQDLLDWCILEPLQLKSSEIFVYLAADFNRIPPSVLFYLALM